MSTKTTFKRVALVAVAALGLGVVSSVAPASALTTEYVTGITVSTNSVPVAGNAGAAVIHTAYFTTSTSTSGYQARPSVLLISSPATSNMTATALTATALAKGGYQWAAEATIGASNTTADADTNLSSQDTTSSTASAVARGADGTRYYFDASYLHAWYDVAGTYKWVFWDDLDNSGTINGSEFSQVATVVVADGTAAITGTVAAHNATSGAGSTYGSLVKISLKDAAGNASNVDSAGGVKVTVSGSAIITTGSNTTSSYIIPNSAFNGSGNAWINVTDAEAEIVSVTLSGVGSSTVTGNVPSLTFVATAGTSTTTPVKLGTGSKIAGSAGSSTASLGSTVSLKTGVTAVAAASVVKEDVNVTDTAGKVTGKASAQYSLAVGNCSTTAYAASVDCGSFSIATGFTQEGQAISVNVGGGTAEVITASRAALTAGTITVSNATRTAAKGSSNSITITVKDQYATAYASAVVTPSLSTTSRNYGLVTFSTLVTDASGKATLTYTDASTSTTNMSDAITFTSTVTGTAAITFTADATLGISTRLITSNDTDSLGVALPVVTPVAISTGDGTEAGASTVSVTLKNAAGTLLSGVPVTWSVAGTGVAMALPTTNTTYSSAGIATASVYAWVAGTYTVTATSGGVAVTVPVTFASTTNTNARIVSATAAGAVVTAKVVDRFGNPVKSVAVSATTTAGYFGSGSTTATGTTSSAGTVDFVLLGASGTVTVSVDKTTYGQTIAAAGATDSDAANVYTATVAATATAAASGVGASIAPKGVNSATAAATVDTALLDTAQAATDAAAEATDAANAATDAANAAAEAADAATAAAQDAADAVAALSAQVASLISGLKAQLTALTNLVIKIQKKVKA